MSTHPIQLSHGETAELRDTIDWALKHHETVTVWIDATDRAFKVKLGRGTWSPPMGTPT
jgi:hypothetical protein